MQQRDRALLYCQRLAMQNNSSIKPNLTIDSVIIGGGIAGAWLLRLLTQKGYNTILLEQDSLGSGQTLASQGMIHGGLKYALSGLLSKESEAISKMPRRWTECLTSKKGEIDLRAVSILSKDYYMFGDGQIGKLASFFASKALRGRIQKLDLSNKPPCFSGFDGLIYKLNDLVLDTESLLSELIKGLEDRVFKLKCSSQNIKRLEQGYEIILSDMRINSKVLINCAGNGSKTLLEELKITEFKTQNRPLKQIIVDAPNQLNMFAHCITNLSSTEPRFTITTHHSAVNKIWYIGGQLATLGADLSDEMLIANAKKELRHCIPWLTLNEDTLRTLNIDRVEPLTSNRLKPDEAFAKRSHDFLQCFPTKLTLAPDLGDKVLQILDPPSHSERLMSTHARAKIGSAPW